jgi:glycolate oxidase FAD binding subunit
MSSSSTSGSSAAPIEVRWNELEALAPEIMRVATPVDAIDGVLPARIIAPASVDQVSAILAWANNNAIPVVPRGGGTKLGWSNTPSNLGLALSLERLNQKIEHAWQDMTVTVDAGVAIAQLQSELAKHGQRLPLDVLWPDRSTVGGVIACNDNGALRLRFGSLRDLILGVTVVLANGTIARSGGRVVKNVAGYDLPKLFTGSFGTLGIITEATLRTYPMPHSVRNLSFRFDDVGAANRFVIAVADTSLVPAGMQLRVRQSESPVVDLRFEGLAEGCDAQAQRATELAGTAEPLTSTDEAWESRESLWSGGEPSIVGKFSVLPTAISDCIQAIQSHFPNSQTTAQSLGLGCFRAQAASPQQLLQSLTGLRSAIRQLGGTLVLLHAPLEIKKVIDVFGERTTAYPLMVRVKQQFDPKGILSPGRFLGGI